jgi:RNA polymerase sigma-70 factor (ECF subfamily)
MNDLSDSELIARCLGPDAPRAFDQLHARHGPCVRAFLHGFTGGDEHRVADCAQETWLRAYRALPRFDRERALRPWLLTIAARVAIDAEARRRRVDVVDQDALAGLSIAWPDARADVRDAVDRLLREAATRVSPRKLETFLLSRAHGLEQREVATRTGSSLATVKRDISETAAILAGLAEELGLLPERVAAAVAREVAPTTWRPPTDGLITARQLEQVLAFFRELHEIADELRDHPVEDVAQAQAFTERASARFDERDDEQAHSWAIGVVKRTARALLAADVAAMTRLKQRAEAELRDLEARHGKTLARREQAERALAADATAEERAAVARECETAARALEVSLRSAEMFLHAAEGAIEAALASGEVDADEREAAAGLLEQREVYAKLDAEKARLEALRRGDAAAWLEHVDRRAAEERATVQGRRDLVAAIERTAAEGQSALLGIPAHNAALVRSRLDEVLGLLGHHEVMAGGEWA